MTRKTKDKRVKAGQGGFTLIETLVAVTLLTVSIVAPMALTARSLGAAHYVREQITAFHLAQEAIETARHVRDGNILKTALGTPTDIFVGIPLNASATVDSINDPINPIDACGGPCPVLEQHISSGIYGYGDSGWGPSPFTRTLRAAVVRLDAGGVAQELRISVTVSWRTGATQRLRSITIHENLYRWTDNT